MMQQQDSASRAAYSIPVQELARRIGADAPDCYAARERAEQALASARSIIQETPIALDLTFTFRPFSLARLLLAHGFRVKAIYADAISAEEEADFRWLQENHGDTELWPTKAPALRLLPRPSHPAGPPVLALGHTSSTWWKAAAAGASPPSRRWPVTWWRPTASAKTSKKTSGARD